MSLLLADALLVLSLLFVRPTAERAWRSRLVTHALLLAGCLLVPALSGPDRLLLPLLGMGAALTEAVLAWRFKPRAPDAAPDAPLPAAVWLLAGLVLVAASLRLLPDGALPSQSAGLLSAALAILLTGLLGAVASAVTSGGGATGRLGSLLLAGHGMLLVACQLPGMAVSSLGCLLLLQGGLLGCLLREWIVPAHAGRAHSP